MVDSGDGIDGDDGRAGVTHRRSSKSGPCQHDAFACPAEPIDDPLLGGGQLRPMLDLDGDAVVMLDDAGEAEAEHLTVYVVVVCGNDAIRRQVLFADFMVAVTGLTLHPACHGTVRIEKISVGWHDAGECDTNLSGSQGATD